MLKKEKLSHLYFADNVMIFSKGDRQSIALIKDALDEFYELSGLQASQEKSYVFLSVVYLNKKRKLCAIFWVFKRASYLSNI